MKKHTFFIVVVIMLLLTSCGNSSISKSEALQIVIEEYGEEHNTNLYIKAEAVPVKDIDYKIDKYRKYEAAGLLKIEETTVRWSKSTPAVLISLTDKGRTCGSVSRSTSNINYLTYKYDGVVDVQLINKLVSPIDDNFYTVSYLIFVKGTATKVSPFATVDNINVGDRYPQSDQHGPMTFMYGLKISYDKDDISRQQLKFLERVPEKETEEKIKEYKERGI